MIRYLIIVIIISMVMISCEKESNIKVELPNIIDTTIISTDTLIYSFGYLGDKEGISIVSETQNAKYCELLNRHWEERILQYIPKSDFLGIDSLIVVKILGTDGVGFSASADTTLIIIRVVKNEFHKRLIGKWNWKSSCGGFVPLCYYPSDDMYVQIEFNNEMRYIEKVNDSIVHEYKYYLIDNFKTWQDLGYEIGFENGYETYYTLWEIHYIFKQVIL